MWFYMYTFCGFSIHFYLRYSCTIFSSQYIVLLLQFHLRKVINFGIFLPRSLLNNDQFQRWTIAKLWTSKNWWISFWKLGGKGLWWQCPLKKCVFSKINESYLQRLTTNGILTACPYQILRSRTGWQKRFTQYLAYC